MSARAWAGILAAAAVIVASVVGLPAAGQEKSSTPAKAKWEYKIVWGQTDKTEELLTKLGEEGWELTHVNGGYPYVVKSDPKGVLRSEIEKTPVVHYLRRAK